MQIIQRSQYHVIQNEPLYGKQKELDLLSSTKRELESKMRLSISMKGKYIV